MRGERVEMGFNTRNEVGEKEMDMQWNSWKTGIEKRERLLTSSSTNFS